jgi:hypothetical protein
MRTVDEDPQIPEDDFTEFRKGMKKPATAMANFGCTRSRVITRLSQLPDIPSKLIYNINGRTDAIWHAV